MPRTSDRAEAKQDDAADKLYAELQTCLGYNAAALRATALFLNAHKSNREFMKAASAEMGRNARNWARAVDYFRPSFTDEPTFAIRTTDDYLKMFTLASVKKATAMDLFTEMGLRAPLHEYRERIAAARAEQRGERKPSLAERIIVIMDERAQATKQVNPPENTQTSNRAYADGIWTVLAPLSKLPEVAAVLARRQKAEAGDA